MRFPSPLRQPGARRATETLLQALLWRQARRYADRIFCYSQYGTLSYNQLATRAAQIAQLLLTAGVQPDDRVALLCGEHPDTLLAYSACGWAGFAAVPLSPRSTLQEITFALDDCEPSAALCSEPFAGVVHQIAASLGRPVVDGHALGYLTLLVFDQRRRQVGRRPPAGLPKDTDDPILVIPYTSGTTSTPKGVIQTQAAHVENAYDYAYFYAMSERSNVLSALPHNAGLLITAFMPAMLVGASVTLMETSPWRAEAFASTVEQFGVTHSELVPTQLLRVLEYSATSTARLATLQRLGYGSAPTPISLINRALGQLGPILVHMYGLTESLSLSCGLTPLDHSDPELRGSIGYPVGRTRMWVADEAGNPLPPNEPGMLIIQSPKLASGYWRRPAETAATFRDGCLITGDVGYVNDRGAFVLVDREKDLIKSGGASVSPAEVDAVIHQSSAVATAVTFGVPDSEWGERVVSAVVLRPGYQQDEVRGELMKLLKTRLSAFKIPKDIIFMDELPTSDVGKVLRRDLAKRLSRQDSIRPET